MSYEVLIQKMREAAPKLAEAKANRVYLTEFRKSKKAILFAELASGTIADRENYAYAHPEYLEVLEGIKEAVRIEEELRLRVKAAELEIELYRTKQADLRTEMRAYT